MRSRLKYFPNLPGKTKQVGRININRNRDFMKMIWYPKRDFSIRIPLLLQNGRGAALQDVPPESALFWEMWNGCQDIAEQVLATDYFRGILDNNLDPNAYGSLMVQDAYYCFKAENSYSAAVTHALDDDCRTFLKKKCESYAEYNETYHRIWHIKETSSVIPGEEIREYADFEAYVAGNLDSPYLFAVMLPCEFLWNWVANQLQPSASVHGLYYFWIEGNAGIPNGAYQMANMLETYRQDIDENRAKEIFRTAMEHELKVFTSSTILNTSELWQQKNTF